MDICCKFAAAEVMKATILDCSIHVQMILRKNPLDADTKVAIYEAGMFPLHSRKNSE